MCTLVAKNCVLQVTIFCVLLLTDYKYSDESTWLAFKLQEALNKELGFESRGVKFANFQVLRESNDCFPSVLLELGFLSNWDESKYYQKSASLQVLALVLMEFLIKKFSFYERVGN